MSRFRRIAGSLAVVLIAYWAYALLAVPWIEPPAELPGQRPPPGREIARPPGDEVNPQTDAIRPLFPPDTWELKDPTILESNRAKLIFQQYRNFPDGRIEIHPCTIVFLYDGPAEDEAQRLRQSIILEAPGGAVLQFDPPLDLSRPKLGRLVGGQLVGKVTIHSDWKEPGPQDDLLIVTRDVQLSEQTVSTPHPVDFRWGPHFGRGREMVIKLLGGRPVPAGTAAERWSEAAGPNIAGIESFELGHVERLHLELGQTMTTPAAKQDSAPVEIQCRGPFHFDVLRRVATFRDGVDVMKLNPSGPADQIACELLSLYFIGRGGASADPGSLDLVAQRLEARGNPVVVTAPSRNLTARGPRIKYNLLDESIALDGAQEVFLQQGPNQIHARSLNYQPAGQGRLGRVTAEGPGWFRGQLADHAGQQLEAVWREQLRVFPDGQNHVIALTGGAELKSPGTGQLQAREIFFWLSEAPPVADGGPAHLRPDRMLARYDVHMNSPQLAGEVEQLEVQFEERDQRSEIRDLRSEVGMQGRGLGGSPPSAPVEAAPSVGMAVELPSQPGLPSQPETPSQPGALQRFRVLGRLLRAHVLLGAEQPGVSHLLVEDGVRFLEEQSAAPDNQQPLQIFGDRLEVSEAAGANAVVTVTGRPARCEARGLGLTGSNIHLDRGTNRLWIDGPGQMDLPFSGGPPGQPPPGPLTVRWRRGMTFDGQIATFEESVVAATPGDPPQQRLQTETMTVQLQRLIRFSEPNAQEPPEIEKIGCHGGVRMESRTFDQQGQQLTWDQLQVPELWVNVQSGKTEASGAGWLHSVRRGSANPLGGTAGGTAGSSGSGGDAVGPANPAAPTPTAYQLICLHVNFQKSIQGTLPLRGDGSSTAVPTGNRPLLYLTFADRVRAAYAPVDRWDVTIPVDDPDRLGPQGMTAHCDQLSVAEAIVPAGVARSGELAAVGNAVVEGATLTPHGQFTARGNRISYDSGKGMLVLEGDGRRDAELLWRPQPGVEPDPVSAQKILYWPKTHGLRIERGRSLAIPQFPNRNGVK